MAVRCLHVWPQECHLIHGETVLTLQHTALQWRPNADSRRDKQQSQPRCDFSTEAGKSNSAFETVQLFHYTRDDTAASIAKLWIISWLATVQVKIAKLFCDLFLWILETAGDFERDLWPFTSLLFAFDCHSRLGISCASFILIGWVETRVIVFSPLKCIQVFTSDIYFLDFTL